MSKNYVQNYLLEHFTTKQIETLISNCWVTLQIEYQMGNDGVKQWLRNEGYEKVWKDRKGVIHSEFQRYDEERLGIASNTWRKQIFERDNYTCQECGVMNGNVHAHHIKSWADYPKLRFEISNGITLCVDCHCKKHPEHEAFIRCSHYAKRKKK